MAAGPSNSAASPGKPKIPDPTIWLMASKVRPPTPITRRSEPENSVFCKAFLVLFASVYPDRTVLVMHARLSLPACDQIEVSQVSYVNDRHRQFPSVTVCTQLLPG